MFMKYRSERETRDPSTNYDNIDILLQDCPTFLLESESA